jgi:Lipocalin-like domain
MRKMNRRALLASGGLSATAIGFGATGVTRAIVVPGDNSSRSLHESLIGAWQLVSCVETDVETGEAYRPMGDKPQGLLLYTPDGYMSAQLSAVDRPNFESGDMYKGKPKEYVAGCLSYLAYSGPYYVDEARRMVEHEMFVSLFPNWKGQRQVRIVKLDENELHLSTNQPQMFNGSLKTAAIVWRRANPNI